MKLTDADIARLRHLATYGIFAPFDTLIPAALDELEALRKLEEAFISSARKRNRKRGSA